MSVSIRKTDGRGRLVLPDDFANQTVIVERVDSNELRLRKKPSLAELLSRITPENTHTEVDAGRPVGREAL